MEAIEEADNSGGYLFSLDRLWQASDPELMTSASVVEVFQMALYIPHLYCVGVYAACGFTNDHLMSVCHSFYCEDSCHSARISPA